VKPWREMVSARYGLSEVATALGQVERRVALKALITPNDA
jgi:hypothetical protein